ncbi:MULTISPECIES: hypothetical protein [Azospirillum]|uniref:Uncharacterized protein n=1 Tax=Azospirillum brasilense TaxID=192 RepID=A0ABU4PHQ4_AZOBR|nr:MULTISPECIES: hypothetical protein [Azospirillum]MDW7554313.1 hypothetical protein [Azospirillum brasilense]MDW7594530.1 hypothetical protein [Azospirillum brasilense]MDW7629384.1 hypothetical protein [Azospirillum brasilense]MDW7629962.1 hypothetical protein [Azospirillum brasilense]MDX5955621.1 hypothetical protein [Azospirillum brasilense]
MAGAAAVLRDRLRSAPSVDRQVTKVRVSALTFPVDFAAFFGGTGNAGQIAADGRGGIGDGPCDVAEVIIHRASDVDAVQPLLQDEPELRMYCPILNGLTLLCLLFYGTAAVRKLPSKPSIPC